MNIKMNNFNPIPDSEYPVLNPYSGAVPILPTAWESVALLHPFSPIQSNSVQADKDSPFFELCVANVSYQEGSFLSAQILGISGRTWWYIISPTGTQVSTDKGVTFNPIDVGWSLPITNWLGSSASCAGTSYLNWMEAQQVNWWKMPVNIPGQSQKAATWMWFDSISNLPVRLMFGQGPAAVAPTKGDPTQLALFQMFSFTYFPVFNSLSSASIPTKWVDPTFQGFAFGNPNNYELFTWNDNFGMTVFMTPVNESFNPLPTEVLYSWKPDNEYNLTSDRSQYTYMKYTYNSGNPFAAQAALLTGPPPAGFPPPAGSGSGFLINYDSNGNPTTCVAGPDFPFPQEPPDWVSIPAEEGTIQACITYNPVLCPNQTVTIVSVLFPPATNYPDSTYLWTWYSPLNASGSSSRPVTFMQSQSGVNKGTSLALADYFYYEEFTTPIDPSNFAIPLACTINFPLSVVVQATQPWQSTDISVAVGDIISVQYSAGTWSAYPAAQGFYDANGYVGPGSPTTQRGYTMLGQNMGALCGYIGDQPPIGDGSDPAFLIGDNYKSASTKSGVLWLCINDDLKGLYGGGLTDNIGSVTMTITTMANGAGFAARGGLKKPGLTQLLSGRGKS